jgi:hypothetical protein
MVAGDLSVGCTGLDEPAPRGATKGEGVANERFGASATGRGNVGNGGGGGVCLMAGGGGGGHGGAGGLGGRSNDGSREVGGMGGASVSYEPLSYLLFGGGGGSGHVGGGFGSVLPNLNGNGLPGINGQGHDEHGNGNGYGHCKAIGLGHSGDEHCADYLGGEGQGGGTIFVRGESLSGRGFIAAVGNPGSTGLNAGGGGGGAGGSIHARFSGPVACGGLLVSGGAGGDSDLRASRSGPGGGGGGGRIYLQGLSTASCPTVVDGGASGNPGADTTNVATPGKPGTSTVVEEPYKEPGSQPGAGGLAVVTPASGTVTSNPRPVILGTYDTPNTSVSVTLDGRPVGTAVTTGTRTWTLTPPSPLADGPHEVCGQVGTSARSCNGFTVDTSVPDTFITSAQTSSPIAQFTFNSNERDVTYECSLDGAAFEPCNRGSAFALVTRGAHTFQVRARDAAGNVDPTPASHGWTVGGGGGLPSASPGAHFEGSGYACSSTGAGAPSLGFLALALSALALRKRR